MEKTNVLGVTALAYCPELREETEIQVLVTVLTVVFLEFIFLHMVMQLKKKNVVSLQISKALLQDILILITVNIQDNIYFISCDDTQALVKL